MWYYDMLIGAGLPVSEAQRLANLNAAEATKNADAVNDKFVSGGIFG